MFLKLIIFGQQTATDNSFFSVFFSDGVDCFIQFMLFFETFGLRQVKEGKLYRLRSLNELCSADTEQSDRRAIPRLIK